MRSREANESLSPSPDKCIHMVLESPGEERGGGGGVVYTQYRVSGPIFIRMSDCRNFATLNLRV